MRRLPARWSAAASAALLACCLGFGAIIVRCYGVADRTVETSPGEQIYHGLSAPNSHMPLKYMLDSVLAFHNPFPKVLQPDLMPLAALLSVFSLAGLLGSATAAGLATISLLGLENLFVRANVFPAILLVLVAAAAVHRARRPGPASTALLAALIGSTLLYRSTLFLLGPSLAAWELCKARRKWRSTLKEAGLLAFAPFLFLLPWIAMNWLAHHKVIPFEYQEADSNIVAGVLGHVTGTEGDWRLLVDDPPDPERSGAVLLWAARRVLTHPGRYAAHVARRWLYFAGLHPGLLFFSMLGLARWRKRPGWDAMLIVAAYYLGIHSLMAMHDSYLLPLQALLSIASGFALIAPPDEYGSSYWTLAVLVGAGILGIDSLDHILQPHPILQWEFIILAVGLGVWTSPDDAPIVKRACVFIAAMGWLLIGASAAVSAERAVAAGLAKSSASGPRALDAAIAANPDDSWLFMERGSEKALKNEAAGAVADLERSLRLRPRSDEARLELALALFRRGLPGALFKEKPEQFVPVDRDLCVRLSLLKGLQLLRWRRSAEARRELEKAWLMWLSEFEVGEGRIQGSIEREAMSRYLAQARAGFIKNIDEELASFPVDTADRRRLAGAFDEIGRR